MHLNRQFEQLRQSATVAMADRVAALLASGQYVIPLQVGDPDFPTPQPILEAARRALQDGLTHYAPSRGFLDLRLAAASKMQRNNGLTYDPTSEILVTHGGIHAYYLALQAILEPGDEVLIPDPTWATHANMVTMLRGTVKRVPAHPEDSFLPTFAAWEQALTPQARVIVLNYPSNPTGAYPERAYLEWLQTFADAHHLWIVSDEVYENLYYGGKPVSAGAFPGAKERTLLVHSLSKTYAMTGWRVGYLAAPARVIENALKAGQNSITCVAPFVQKAAAFALSDPGVQTEAANMRAQYARRRERVLQMAAEMQSEKVRVTPPMGAFYFFLDFRALGLPSSVICERILEEARVGLVPGSAFGTQGEGFARLSIAASDADVEEGFKKVVEWADAQETKGD
ncbi:MAG: pyridoxal phosphate-dependent aminotransferase [Anaerolineales bacterium]